MKIQAIAALLCASFVCSATVDNTAAQRRYQHANKVASRKAKSRQKRAMRTQRRALKRSRKTHPA